MRRCDIAARDENPAKPVAAQRITRVSDPTER
jgi:hypothetical protein